MGNVLVAFERSGIVRDAFITEGHFAVSCDLVPTDSPGPHIQCDARALLRERWDLVVAHPPCSYLCHYGWAFKKNRIHNPRWWRNCQEAVALFVECLDANAPLIAVENPPTMNIMARRTIGPPSIQTNFAHFGGQKRKRVGFWTRGLPPLIQEYRNPNASPVVVDWEGVQHKMSSTQRRLNRARFEPELAAAMAKQWGCFVPS